MISKLVTDFISRNFNSIYLEKGKIKIENETFDHTDAEPLIKRIQDLYAKNIELLLQACTRITEYAIQLEQAEKCWASVRDAFASKTCHYHYYQKSLEILDKLEPVDAKIFFNDSLITPKTFRKKIRKLLYQDDLETMRQNYQILLECLIGKTWEKEDKLKLYPELITLLLEKSSVCDLALSSEYLTSLHYAAMVGDSLRINEIQKKTPLADLDSKSLIGTPLTIALDAGNFEFAEKLIEKGAFVDAPANDQNETALHLAIKAEDLQQIKFLLKHNASQTSKDCFLMTPLHYSCIFPKANTRGQMSIIRQLLKKQQCPLLNKDCFGFSPLDYLRFYENKQAAALLVGQEKAGALFNLEDSPKTGPHIDQTEILFQLFKYLELEKAFKEEELEKEKLNLSLEEYQMRLEEIENPALSALDNEGCCNGFCFLRTYYKNEYFKILNLISNWNNQRESLFQSIEGENLSGNYRSLKDLFCSIINEIGWFQQNKSVFGNFIDQGDLVFLYSKIKKDPNLLLFQTTPNLSCRLNEEKLKDLLSIFCKHPELNIFIQGEGHISVINVMENNTLDYYDTEFPWQTHPLSVEEVAKLICGIHFGDRNGEAIDCSIQSLKFYKKSGNFQRDLEVITKIDEDRVQLTRKIETFIDEINFSLFFEPKNELENAIKRDWVSLAKESFDSEEGKREFVRLNEYHFSSLFDELVAEQNPEMFEFIIDAGVDFNLKDIKGVSLLEKFSRVEDPNFLKMLIQSLIKAEKEEDLQHLLKIAIKNDRYDIQSLFDQNFILF